MSDPREQPNQPPPIVQELIDEHALVSYDVIPIDGNTWAIHGLIAVDGDVLMAEFNSVDEATTAIEEIQAGVAQPLAVADDSGLEWT